VITNLRSMKKLVCCILLMLLLGLAGCNWVRNFDFQRGDRVTGGDPELGRKKLGQHSCISCHTIPGVPRAEGMSGGALAGWAGRRTFLHTFPNTPDNLEKWLQNPSHRKPGTTMPNLSVSTEDGRDMAAYLFSIN